jgi:RNA polymerase sigma-70 factor (ECF subfamily)
MHATEKAIYPTAWSVHVTGEHAAARADPDNAAIDRFLAGDGTAFDELYSRYAAYVHNIAYGVLGDADLAADVTQEVFLQVYRSLPVFRRGSRFATWLYRIAVNRAVDAGRRIKRRRWVPFSPTLEQKPDVSADPAVDDDRRDTAMKVSQVLRQLPRKHQQVLALRYFRELTIEEIAEALGCTPTAAKVRLYRAREKFKEKYASLYPEEFND